MTRTALRGARRAANRAAKRATSAFWRLLFRHRAPGCPLPPARVRRVLVLRQDAAGDLIATTPALSYLKAVAPHAEVDVLATPKNAALLAGDARVARVFVNPFRWRAYPRLLRALRARRYDVILAAGIHKHRREGLVSALAAGPSTVRASLWRPPDFHGLFTHVVRVPVGRHMAHRFLHLAQAAVGDAPPRRLPDLARWPLSLARDPAADARAAAYAAAVGGPFAAVNLWTRDPTRDVPAAAMVEALGCLARRHPELTFVVTPPPSPAGRAEGARVAREAAAAAGDADGARVRVAPDDLSLRDLVALVRRAAMVVSANTATVHIGSAVGTPVLGLYAPNGRDLVEWTPVGVPHRVVAAPDGRPLAELTAAQVVDAFDALWAEVRAGAR